MRVFHASYVEIVDIDLSKCEPFKDFGKGFYVTNIRQQAQFWAIRKGENNQTEGYITEFEFTEDAFEYWKFNVLRFVDYTEEWLDFVISNRKAPLLAHTYDLVE
jgi:hypothetical protein